MIINKGQEYNLPILFSQCICDEEISSMTIYLYTNSPDGCVEYALGSGVSLTSKTTAIVHVEPGDLDGLPDGLLSYACDYNDIIHEGQTTYVLNTPGNYQPLPSPEESYESGYTSGYSVGFEEGYESGSTGGEAYYQSGYTDGYNSGYTSGYSRGESAGHWVAEEAMRRVANIAEYNRRCLVFERVIDNYSLNPGNFSILFIYQKTGEYDMNYEIQLSYSFDGISWTTQPFGETHTTIEMNVPSYRKLYVKVPCDFENWGDSMPWWDCKIVCLSGNALIKVSGDLSALLKVNMRQGKPWGDYGDMPYNPNKSVRYDFSGLFSDFGYYNTKLDAGDLRFVVKEQEDPNCSGEYKIMGDVSYENLFGSTLLQAPKLMEYYGITQDDNWDTRIDLKGIYTACTNIQYAYIYKNLEPMLDYMSGIYSTEITMSDILPSGSSGGYSKVLYTNSGTLPALPTGWLYNN